MAQNKSSNKSTKSTSTSTSSSKKSSGVTWGINKISFYLIGAAAILYLVVLLLAAFEVSSTAVLAIQGVVTAFIISVVAYLAWKYVRGKPMVWKVLYVVFLLVVLIGIIVPLVKM